MSSSLAGHTKKTQISKIKSQKWERSHSGRVRRFRQPEADPPWAEKQKMHYVYILKGINNKLYKGSTDDLKKRIVAHNSGRVRSTKIGRPWELLYYEAFTNKKLARKEELFLKTGKGRERIKFLLDIK